MKENQIKTAAKKLFTAYGFKKVTMDEIAEEAGVTKKTVYTYFQSKEDLLKACIQNELKTMRKIVEKTESKNTDFFIAIHESICELLKYKKKSNFLKQIFKESEALRSIALKENLKIIDNEIKNYIRAKLVEATEKHLLDIQNIDVMTFLIYKMYIALMIDWNEDYKKLDEQEVADTILSILKNGIGRKEVEVNEKYSK